VHEPDIDALRAAGVTQGCSADGRSFCPTDAVTRAQVASFLARALGLSPTPPPPRTSTTTTTTGGGGAANAAPVLGSTVAPLAYAEGVGPAAVDPGLTVVDDGALASATVAITSGYVAGEDVLALPPQPGLAASFDAGTATLTVTGTAGPAAYQTALRSVTYRNTSDTPSPVSRTVSFRVTDAGGLSSTAATRDITVAAVNDAPVVATSAGSATYTEGDPAAVVDGGLAVTDVDDLDLEGAAVVISGGFRSGDELFFVNQNGISGIYDAGGVLTLTGTAPVATYQSALRSVGFRTTNDDPSTSRTVTVTVDDGDATSAPAARSITVTAVNDAPVVATSAGSAAYTEGGAPVVVDPGLTVADPDSTQLSGATVQITGGFSSAEDLLAFVPQSGITGSYNATTGTLTLSGTASVADYQAALRSVTYANSSGAPSTATRTVSFQVSDAQAATSNAATRDVTVAASGV
jgi:hypothetical protein